MSSSSITTIRRMNALALFNEFAAERIAGGEGSKGAEQAFAEHIGLKPSSWSAHRSSRPIGDKVARQMETTCQKEAGWLDVDRPHLRPDAAEVAYLSLAQAVWRQSNASQKKELKKQMKDALKSSSSGH